MSGLIPVAEALSRVLASVHAPVEAETVPIIEAAGRTLAADLVATRAQPPFRASAMDGYALRSADLSEPPTSLRCIGTSAAGHGFTQRVEPGTCVRIFTGAPVPEGADAVLMQEDVVAQGDLVTTRESLTPGRNVREAGTDFGESQVLLQAGESLDPRRIALAASAGRGRISVRRRPRVAILATGDELVLPGMKAAWDQIYCSNALALSALVREAGAEAIDLGIASDDLDAQRAAIRAAREAGADILVTLGGASVGDHDLVQRALSEEGMELGFWRIALRPGKPLMQGRLGDMLAIGLPGNPVSAIVCGLLFVVPSIRALLGDPQAGTDRSEPAILGRDLPANQKRQDYMRARLDLSPDRLPIAHPEARQDSSMLTTLGRSEALLIRPPKAPAARMGEACRILRLDRGVV